MMMVPVMVTIGNGNEAYCSCEENADRDTMVGSLMVRKTMMAALAPTQGWRQLCNREPIGWE